VFAQLEAQNLLGYVAACACGSRSRACCLLQHTSLFLQAAVDLAIASVLLDNMIAAQLDLWGLLQRQGCCRGLC
jgi:hypothetical protein